jgi:hypothetical protein
VKETVTDAKAPIHVRAGFAIRSFKIIFGRGRLYFNNH